MANSDSSADDLQCFLSTKTSKGVKEKHSSLVLPSRGQSTCVTNRWEVKDHSLIINISTCTRRRRTRHTRNTEHLR